MKQKHTFRTRKNESGIVPVGHFVLIEPEQVEETTKSGIVVAVGKDLDKEQMGQTDGIIVAVGDDAWDDQASPFAQPGDRVVFGRYNGLLRKQPNGKSYRLISDLEVVARLEN